MIDTTTESAETINEIVTVRRSGGDKQAQAMREAMDKLIASVDLDNWDVDEYKVLGDIMVRSGLMWRCVDPSCRGINHQNCSSCDSCGKRKPKSRDIPQADTWA